MAGSPFFSQLNNIPLNVYASSSFFTHRLPDTDLFPCLGTVTNASVARPRGQGGGAYISPGSCFRFLRTHTQKWDSWTTRYLCFLIFWGNFMLVSIAAATTHVPTHSANRSLFLFLNSEFWAKCYLKAQPLKFLCHHASVNLKHVPYISKAFSEPPLRWPPARPDFCKTAGISRALSAHTGQWRTLQHSQDFPGSHIAVYREPVCFPNLFMPVALLIIIKFNEILGKLRNLWASRARSFYEDYVDFTIKRKKVT